MEAQSPSKETLIVVARVPGSGRPPARLAKDVGEPEAERLLAAFLADTVALANTWRHRALPGTTRLVALYVPDSTDDALAAEAAARCGAKVFLLSGTEPGEQLSRALLDELDRGAHRVFLVGAAAPSLPVHLVEEGLRAVLFHSVVLGPTFEDGLWGVGLARPDSSGAPAQTALEGVLSRLALGVPGRVPEVVESAAKAAIPVHVLPYWPDVGTRADLARTEAHLRYLEVRGSSVPGATRAVLANPLPPRPAPQAAKGSRRP